MKSSNPTTTIWTAVAILLVSCSLVVAQSEQLKKEFDWTDSSYFAGAPPKTIGILIVTYHAFGERDGQKVHLDPKLGAKTAHASPKVWLAYKPELDNSKATQQVRDEIITLTKTSLTGLGFEPRITATEKPDTVQAYLGQLPKCDCFLVIAIADVGPRLMAISGKQSAISQATTDFILLSSDMKPVAGCSRFSLQPLKTIGKLDKDYEVANPFQKGVAFRYTTRALVDSVAPVVRDGIVKPFAEALKAMSSTKK